MQKEITSLHRISKIGGVYKILQTDKQIKRQTQPFKIDGEGKTVQTDDPQRIPTVVQERDVTNSGPQLTSFGAKM